MFNKHAGILQEEIARDIQQDQEGAKHGHIMYPEPTHPLSISVHFASLFLKQQPELFIALYISLSFSQFHMHFPL